MAAGGYPAVPGTGEGAPGDTGQPDPFKSDPSEMSVLDRLGGDPNLPTAGDVDAASLKEPIRKPLKPIPAQKKASPPATRESVLDRVTPADQPPQAKTSEQGEAAEPAEPTVTADETADALPEGMEHFDIKFEAPVTLAGKTFGSLSEIESHVKSLMGQQKRANKFEKQARQAVDVANQWIEYARKLEQGGQASRPAQQPAPSQASSQSSKDQTTEGGKAGPEGGPKVSPFIRSTFQNIDWDGAERLAGEKGLKHGLAHVALKIMESVETHMAEREQRFREEHIEPARISEQTRTEIGEHGDYFRSQMSRMGRDGKALYPELQSDSEAEVERVVRQIGQKWLRLPKSERLTPEGFRAAYLLWRESVAADDAEGDEGEGEAGSGGSTGRTLLRNAEASHAASGAIPSNGQRTGTPGRQTQARGASILDEMDKAGQLIPGAGFRR